MPVNLKDSDKFFTNIAVQASSGIFTLLDNTAILRKIKTS